jgi:hypothetical protein
MVGGIILLLSFAGNFYFTTCLSNDEPHVCYNKFEYEYDVLQKLVMLEEKTKQQEEKSNALRNELSGNQYFYFLPFSNYVNLLK